MGQNDHFSQNPELFIEIDIELTRVIFRGAHTTQEFKTNLNYNTNKCVNKLEGSMRSGYHLRELAARRLISQRQKIKRKPMITSSLRISVLILVQIRNIPRFRCHSVPFKI